MYGPLFQGKTDMVLKSMINDCLKRKRAHNVVEVPSATGSSPPPIEEEFQQLDKVAVQLVDAISTAKAQICKEKKIQDEKGWEAHINVSHKKGMQNCQPSSGATPFPSVMFRTGRGGGSRAPFHFPGGSAATGGNDPATPGSGSNEPDGSTPAFDQSINQLAIQDSQRRRGVIPLRRELQDALVANGGFLKDHTYYRTKTGASDADLTRFFDDGWFGEELSPDMALNIMTLFIYNLGNTVPGGESSFNGPLDIVEGTGNREDNRKGRVIWSQLEFVGIPEASLLTLCTHYNADLDHLRSVATASAFKLYTEGWIGDQLPSDVVDFLNQTLAMLLLTGEEFDPPGDDEDGDGDHEESDGDDDDGNNGSDNCKGKRRVPKSGRKTRRQKHKVSEDTITSQIISLAHSAAKDQKASRADEAKYRREKSEQLERQWVRGQQALKEQRVEDERIRKEEREEAARVRKEERDENARVRKEEKEVRDHEFRMMLLNMLTSI